MYKLTLIFSLLAFVLVGSAQAQSLIIIPTNTVKLEAEKTEIDLTLMISEDDYYDQEDADWEIDEILPGDVFSYFHKVQIVMTDGARTGSVNIERTIASTKKFEGMIITDGYRFKQLRRLEAMGFKSQGISDMSVMRALEDPALGRELHSPGYPYRCRLKIEIKCYLKGETAKLEESGGIIFPLDPIGRNWNRTNFKKTADQVIADNHIPALGPFQALVGPANPPNYKCVIVDN